MSGRSSKQRLDSLQNAANRPVKKVKHVADENKTYREASSDDEFAQQYFILPTDDSKKRKKSNRKEVEDSDCSSSTDSIEYRVQLILGRSSKKPSEWCEICVKMDTREVTRGSVWQQPDEEFFDSSDIPIEKFLIKWSHASYLHLSWETEKDLIENVGGSIRTQIKRFIQKESRREEIFEDLSYGEYFPASFLQIDRVLDIDDPIVRIPSVDWKHAKLPELPSLTTASNVAIVVDEVEQTEEEIITDDNAIETEDAANESNSLSDDDDNKQEQETAETAGSDDAQEDNDEDENDEDDDDLFDEDELEDIQAQDAAIRRKRRTNILTLLQEGAGTDKTACKSGRSLLHSAYPKCPDDRTCWLTVKWEGQVYSESTYEDVADLRKAGIEYAEKLREFYRREQLIPVAKIGMHKNSAVAKKVKRVLSAGPVCSSEPPVFPGDRSLRDYQWEGVRWMLFNWSQRRNSILCDEMGLGKTIQAASFLQMLKRHQSVRGPFLVVAPLSTIVQWQREVNAWTDLDCIIYHGSQEDRSLIREHEFFYMSRKKSDGYKLEVVVTTPETCTALDVQSSSSSSSSGAGHGKIRRELSKIHWEIVIIDEAHKLKNSDSKLTATLRDEYDASNYVLLTGTPLQNSTEELWTLLNFVDRTGFASKSDFESKFGEMKTSAQLDALHNRLKPYILRREKEHVEKKVPPKEEIIVEVELTVPQKQYYRAIYEQKTGFLYKGGAKDGPSLSNLAMELRKCCNHPFLVKGAEAEISKHFVGESPVEIMIKSSGKLTLLDKLLPKLHRDGHRVLIFSQFRIMLNIIEDYMSYRGFTYERVDGAITGKKRQAAIDRYSGTKKTASSSSAAGGGATTTSSSAPVSSSPPELFAMLLSTRAGGVGINLTAADTVIIFDSDWNPQNDIQAQARAHRIGQTRCVKVYRLLTVKTYETAMFKAASIKLGLDYAIMHNIRASQGQASVTDLTKEDEEQDCSKVASLAGISSTRAEHVSSMSKKELENLLKHGAYDVFRDDKTGKDSLEASRKFCEEDIEEILQRSSVYMHDENKKSISAVANSKNFSKASFVSSNDAGNDVAIDDPDFWAKVVGLAAGADELHEHTHRRKCRVGVNSYKEAGMEMFMYSDNDSSDGEHPAVSEPSISNSSSVDVRKLKSHENVPAAWNDISLNRLLCALLDRGYGNWTEIRAESKLHWSVDDVKRASRRLILQLLLWSSLSTSSTQREKQFGESSEREVFEDLSFFDKYLRSHKACRLALVALMNETTDSAITLADEDSLLLSLYRDSAADSDDQVAVDSNSWWTKYDSLVRFDNPNAAGLDVLSVDVISQPYQLVSGVPAQIEPVQSKTAKGKKSEVTDYPTLQNLVRKIKSKIGLPNDFTRQRWQSSSFKGGEKELAELVAKTKGIARVRLNQIEDMIELHLVVTDRTKITPVVVAEASEATTETAAVIASAVPAAINQAAMDLKRMQLLAQFCQAAATQFSVSKSSKQETTPEAAEADNSNNSEIAWWSAIHNCVLLCGVNKFGWPDTKRRLRKLALFFESKSAFPESIMQQLKIDDVAAGTDSADKDTVTELMDRENLRDALLANLLPSKFVLKKCKEFAGVLREIHKPRAEMVSAEEKLAAAAVAQAVKQAKARKALTANVLRTLQKFGRPRKVYDELLGISKTSGDFVLDTSYMFGWPHFCSLCEIDGESDLMQEVQDLVQNVVDTYIQYISDLDVDPKSKLTAGMLEGITYSSIEGTMEKCDWLHQIRLALCLMTEKQLGDMIAKNCKGTGPAVAKANLETGMPVWWTIAHDVLLLKTVLLQGLCGWKKLASEPCISSAAQDFVMPARVQGIEWEVALTPKAVEKRFKSLLKGVVVPSKVCNNSLTMPPGSPVVVNRRLASAAVKTSTAGKARSAKTTVEAKSYGVLPSWASNMKQPAASTSAAVGLSSSTTATKLGFPSNLVSTTVDFVEAGEILDLTPLPSASSAPLVAKPDIVFLTPAAAAAMVIRKSVESTKQAEATETSAESSKSAPILPYQVTSTNMSITKAPATGSVVVMPGHMTAFLNNGKPAAVVKPVLKLFAGKTSAEDTACSDNFSKDNKRPQVAVEDVSMSSATSKKPCLEANDDDCERKLQVVTPMPSNAQTHGDEDEVVVVGEHKNSVATVTPVDKKAVTGKAKPSKQKTPVKGNNTKSSTPAHNSNNTAAMFNSIMSFFKK